MMNYPIIKKIKFNLSERWEVVAAITCATRGVLTRQISTGPRWASTELWSMVKLGDRVEKRIDLQSQDCDFEHQKPEED